MNKSRIVDVKDINILNKEVFPRVLNYTASWCGPCKQISPALEHFSVQFPSVHFFKIDIDKHRDHADAIGIKSVPTFIFYKNILTDPIVIKGANIEKIEKAILFLVS